MTKTQRNAFSEFRHAFKNQIAVWQTAHPNVEFVYNKDLDKITSLSSFLLRITPE